MNVQRMSDHDYFKQGNSLRAQQNPNLSKKIESFSEIYQNGAFCADISSTYLKYVFLCTGKHRHVILRKYGAQDSVGYLVLKGCHSSCAEAWPRGDDRFSSDPAHPYMHQATGPPPATYSGGLLLQCRCF